MNLLVDHSQIVQLECLRSGLWGNKSLWGRVLTYKGWSLLWMTVPRKPWSS